MSVLSQSLPALASHLLPYDYWDFSLFVYIDYRTMLLLLSKIEEDLGDSSKFHFESANFNMINVTNAPWLSSKLVSRLLCVWKLYWICVVASDCIWPTWQKHVLCRLYPVHCSVIYLPCNALWDSSACAHDLKIPFSVWLHELVSILSHPNTQYHLLLWDSYPYSQWLWGITLVTSHNNLATHKVPCIWCRKVKPQI